MYQQSFHIIVYILLWAAVEVVCEVIHKTAARIQIQHLSAFSAIMEDFNNITLCSHPTGFVQLFFTVSAFVLSKCKGFLQCLCPTISWQIRS